MEVKTKAGPTFGRKTRSEHQEFDNGRVIRSGLVVVVLVVLAQTCAQVLDFGLGLHGQALDSDVHGSIFGIASLLAQALVAVAAVRRSARSPRRGAWLLLSALILVLLVPRILIPAFAVLLLPLLAAVFVLVSWLSSNDPRRVQIIVGGALSLLVLSFVLHAVGMRLLTAFGYGAGGWAYQVKGILKHDTELAGWLLLATGVVAASLPSWRSAGRANGPLR